ncbi:MAG: lipase/acyltransferase domain-containing protein [Pyrinomonadaceae bacterium]
MKRQRRLQFIVHRSAFIVLLVALATASAGCGARRTPDLGRIFAGVHERKGKRPVIVIPGILGSRIVNRRTGEVVWPSVFRSDVDGLSLPTTPDLAANHDELVAARIVEGAKLAGKFGPEVYVYYHLIRALVDYGGYREGDWANPPEGGDEDTFYVFAYDWRRDNVESARLLVKRVEALKLKLGRPDLRFNVVAHSMGGLVARYAAMYGDQDLPPTGTEPRPDWAGASFVNKIFMFGTPNAGSAEAFAVLLEGYSVTEGLRRRVHLLNKLSREDVLTAPSIFQLLPHVGAVRFLDRDLRPLDVDLYDPATWRRFGWSAANDPAFRAAYERGAARDEEAPTGHGTLADLDAYLDAVLARARRFHEALDAQGVDAGNAPVKLFAFGGDCEETLNAPVVVREEKSGRWLTLTRPTSLKGSDGRRLKREEVVRAMYAPGDGRVTRDSLMGVGLGGAGRASALYETPLPVVYAAFACDLHSGLQNNRTLQDNALTLLVNELTS